MERFVDLLAPPPPPRTLTLGFALLPFQEQSNMRRCLWNFTPFGAGGSIFWFFLKIKFSLRFGAGGWYFGC